MSFFEVEFPRNIGVQAPRRSGRIQHHGEPGTFWPEQRNRNWANSRGKWTIDLQTPTPLQYGGTCAKTSSICSIRSYWLSAGRRMLSRLFDHVDNTANGVNHRHRQRNGDRLPAHAHVYDRRPNLRPQHHQADHREHVTNYQGAAPTNSVLIYANGTLQTSGWTVDYTTGACDLRIRANFRSGDHGLLPVPLSGAL